MKVESSLYILDINDDGMSASMCMLAPENEETTHVSEYYVRNLLKSYNIVAGVQDAAVHAMVESIMYNEYVVVARGKAPTRGADGYFVFEKDTKDMKKQPLILESGNADYKNSFQLATIKQGELLATYVPASQGECGYDIHGKVSLALGPGKDLLPLRGKGLVSDEEKRHYYAAYDGHIVMEGKSVSIEKLYTIHGDLGIEIGNIRFDGDVEVCGDMRSGMEIECKGDVFIHGHVGACKISAGQNITIEKGVQGRDDCSISAKGNVTCKFVERCSIYAEGSVYADSVLGARVTAREQVVVTSKAGNVVGSEVYGMRGVVVKEAGNDAGTPTLLRAGLPRQEYARATELRGKIAEIDGKIASFEEHLATLKEQDEKSAQMRTQIMRAKIVLGSDRKACEEELEVIETRVQKDTESSFVHVEGISHAGVRIYIGDKPFIVSESMKEVAYQANHNEVVCMPLTEKGNS